MPDDQTQIAIAGQPTSSRRSLPRNLIILAMAAAASLGAAWWGTVYWTQGRFIESTNNAYLQADAVVISPKISGYVTAVTVGDNQSVAAGQVLVRIDATQYQAALDLAAAELAQRQADLVRFQAEARRQEAARDQAMAQIGVAESAARLAAAEAQRFDGLARTGAETAERRDQADSTREQSAGQAKAARAAAETAARELETMKAQIGQGEAAIGAAAARLRAARADLDGVAITAPIAGAIGDRTVRAGQYVQPGTRLMTVVPLRELYLVANFKETQLGRIRPGQHADITVDALPGARIGAVVESVAPGTGAQFALLPPENATGNFTKIVQRVPVRLRLECDPALRDALRPGLSAEVAVDTKPRAAP